MIERIDMILSHKFGQTFFVLNVFVLFEK